VIGLVRAVPAVACEWFSLVSTDTIGLLGRIEARYFLLAESPFMPVICPADISAAVRTFQEKTILPPEPLLESERRADTEMNEVKPEGTTSAGNPDVAAVFIDVSTKTAKSPAADPVGNEIVVVLAVMSETNDSEIDC